MVCRTSAPSTFHLCEGLHAELLQLIRGVSLGGEDPMFRVAVLEKMLAYVATAIALKYKLKVIVNHGYLVKYKFYTWRVGLMSGADPISGLFG